MDTHAPSVDSRIKALYNLSEIDTDKSRWGGKAAGAFILEKNGFRIPKSVVLGAEYLSSQLPEVTSFFKSTGVRSKDVELACSLLRKKIDSICIDDLVFGEGKPRDALQEILMRGAVTRSSGSLEDGNISSFAGCYETCFGARDIETLSAHIKTCWKSAYSPAVMQYRNDHGIIAHSGISVLIQEQLQCEKAGVCFSMNPVSGDEEEIIIEANWGNGLSVVSGSVQPDQYRVDAREGGLETKIGDKPIYTIFDFGGFTNVETPRDIREILCLSTGEVMDIAKMAVSLRNTFDCHIDMEWGIHNGSLYIFQCRPVTAGMQTVVSE